MKFLHSKSEVYHHMISEVCAKAQVKFCLRQSAELLKIKPFFFAPQKNFTASNASNFTCNSKLHFGRNFTKTKGAGVRSSHTCPIVFIKLFFFVVLFFLLLNGLLKTNFVHGEILVNQAAILVVYLYLDRHLQHIHRRHNPFSVR